MLDPQRLRKSRLKFASPVSKSGAQNGKAQCYNIFMSRTIKLYKLQSIDTDIDRRRLMLAKIAKLMEGNSDVANAKALLDKATDASKAAEKERDDIRFERQQVEAKRTASDKRLYSGNVKDPKEMQDLQALIQSLGAHLETLEDRQLVVMEEVDVVNAKLAEAQAAYDKVRNAFATEQSKLAAKKTSLESDVEKLRKARVGADAALSPDDKKRYMKLRKLKKGIAVTLIKDGACSSCGSSLASAELQRARSAADLTACPTCGRIMHF